MIGLVLAAGEGRRMGGPKALLAWDGRALLVAHFDAALRAGCGRVVGVVRAHIACEFPARSLPSCASLVVSAEDDALGPAGSIAAFARDAFDEALVALTPVDVVPDAWSVVASLAAALEQDPQAVAARPAFGPRRGHPVVVRATTLRAHYGASASGPPRPLRDVFAAHGRDVLDVPVDTNAVLADLDAPSDLARWR